MKNVEIVSASAGTGKTHTITEDLAERISTGAARPARIIATTFTKKAAADLQKRARQCLVAKSEVLRAGGDEGAADKIDKDLRELQAARIGTIHSVCFGLIEDFAFEAGIAPGLRILDKEEAENLRDKVLGEVLTDEEIRVADDLGHRMVAFDWKDVVLTLIGEARSNAIGAAALRSHAAHSCDGIGELIDAMDCRAEDVDEALIQALRRFVTEISTDDTTKVTVEVLRLVRHSLAVLVRSNLPWSSWVKLVKAKPSKKSSQAYAPVVAAAEAHARHPRLLEDMQRAAALVHEVAARTLETFQEEMRSQGLCDYVGLELRALELLGKKVVRDRLEGQIDLLLVDEFQDTSPIQLEIFIRLARIAKESIWVGDQKQAIYAFRGADPALMEALLARFAAKRAPRILSESWRSMPNFVALTSKLFVPAFAQHGIDRAYVEISAAEAKDWPKPFAPVLERWQIDAKNIDDDALALASCVRSLLDDPEQRVRDREDEAVRRLRPNDIAILCKTKKVVAKVAAALNREGIITDTPRPGLESCSEVLVALAAFRLLLDPGDRLARAKLARFILDPGRPHAWLDEMLTAESEPFADLDELRALRRASTTNMPGSATAAFDCALEAVRVVELCRRWGEGDARLRNLERLRALAFHHEQSYIQRGRALAPAGLLFYLEGLSSESQAPRSGSQAVHVGTWHGSKGLEWPVVVLYELQSKDRSDVLGVHAMPRRDGFDVDAPLAGRWLRYWPWPYHANNKGLPLNLRLDKHPESARIKRQGMEQGLRLLYVGWTRARDRIVLAARAGQLCVGPLGLIPGLMENGDKLCFEGDVLPCNVRIGVPGEARDVARMPSDGPMQRAVREYPPAYRSPSQIAGDGEIREVVQLGDRLVVSAGVDMRLVGEALHAFLACDDKLYDEAFRMQLAREQFENYGVAAAVSASDCLLASDRLRVWIGRQWPGAIWRREWPVCRWDGDASLVRGTCDLVLEVDGDVVIIDHKSFPGSLEDGIERARCHAAQVEEYARAVSDAKNGKILSCWVHLPMVGAVVCVRC